jgi:hypothetical protein
MNTEFPIVTVIRQTRRKSWTARVGNPSRGTRLFRRKFLAILFVSLAVVGLPPAPRAQVRPPSEYELKAAFLYNFAKFIAWPDSSFPSARSPFTICVLGTDPFGQMLDDVLRDKTVGDRAVAIERLKNISQARQCQMIFVSQSEVPRLAVILQGLQGARVLVVGESEGFAEAGGTLQFTLEDDHLRFLINTDAAQRAGLNVSSKLLSLARVVHDPANKGRS